MELSVSLYSYPEYPPFVRCCAVGYLPIMFLPNEPAHPRRGHQSVSLVAGRFRRRILQIGFEASTLLTYPVGRTRDTVVFGHLQKYPWVYFDHCRAFGRPVHVERPDAHPIMNPVEQPHAGHRAYPDCSRSDAMKDRSGVQSHSSACFFGAPMTRLEMDSQETGDPKILPEWRTISYKRPAVEVGDTIAAFFDRCPQLLETGRRLVRTWKVRVWV